MNDSISASPSSEGRLVVPVAASETTVVQAVLAGSMMAAAMIAAERLPEISMVTPR